MSNMLDHPISQKKLSDDHNSEHQLVDSPTTSTSLIPKNLSTETISNKERLPIMGFPEPDVLIHWMSMDDCLNAYNEEKQMQELDLMYTKKLFRDALRASRRLGYSLHQDDLTKLVSSSSKFSHMGNTSDLCFRQRGGGGGSGKLKKKDEGNNGISVNLVLKTPRNRLGAQPGAGGFSAQAGGFPPQTGGFPPQGGPPPNPMLGSMSNALNSGAQIIPFVVAIPVPMTGAEGQRNLRQCGAQRGRQYQDAQQVVQVVDRNDPRQSREFIVNEVGGECDEAGELRSEDVECDGSDEGSSDSVPDLVIYGKKGEVLKLRGRRMNQPIVIVNGGTVARGRTSQESISPGCSEDEENTRRKVTQCPQPKPPADDCTPNRRVMF